MGKTLVIGLQWGDEGKGKIIDCISEKYDIVARFQGGNNAGHTVVAGDKIYKLSLIPSGVLHNKIGFLGSGVVISLPALFAEIDHLQELGVKIGPDTLKIAQNAILSLPLYEIQDALYESLRGDKKIGTTGKGIGVAYQDAAARRALHVIDIFEPTDVVRGLLGQIYAVYGPFFQSQGQPLPSIDQTLDELCSYRDKIQPYLVHPFEFFHYSPDKSQSVEILFEGAQGVMLDVKWGTYPFVTSSSTLPHQIFGGTGAGFGGVDRMIGVAKAYCTRVGEGPLFTEDKTEFGQTLSKRGVEVGTVTGRERRCGALDLVALRYAVKLSGVTEMALTKLDVLDGLDKIPVCIAYEIGDKQMHYPPILQSEQQRVRPVYAWFQGWQNSTKAIKKFDDLPEGAKAYVEFVASFTKCPVRYISVGADREQTIEIPAK